MDRATSPIPAPAFVFGRDDLATVEHAGRVYRAGFLAPEDWGQLSPGQLVFVRTGGPSKRGPLLAGRVRGNELGTGEPLCLDVLAAGTSAAAPLPDGEGQRKTAPAAPPAPAVCALARDEIRGVYLALGGPPSAPAL